MQGDDPTPPSHTYKVLNSLFQAASRVPSLSSKATRPSVDAIGILFRMKKLDSQMVILIYHKNPWMWISI